MADNTQLPVPNTSGDIIATDDISGVKYQRVKLIHGAEGVNDGDVSTNNPLPVINQSLQDLTTAMNATQEQIKNLSDTMLYFITATLDKMPLLDSNDRAQTRIGAIDSNLTLTTLTNLNNFSGGNTALIPYNIGAGAFHIYNNITVS